MAIGTGDNDPSKRSPTGGGTYQSNPERGVFGNTMDTSAAQFPWGADDYWEARGSGPGRDIWDTVFDPFRNVIEATTPYPNYDSKTGTYTKEPGFAIRDPKDFGSGSRGGMRADGTPAKRFTTDGQDKGLGVPGGGIVAGGGGGGGTGGFDQYSAYGFGNFTPQGQGQAEAFNTLGNELYGRAAPVMPQIDIDWSGYGGGGGGGLRTPGNPIAGLPPPPIRTAPVNPTAFGGVMNPTTGMSTVVQRPPETITGGTYIPNARIGVDPTAMGGFGTPFKGFEQTQIDAAANRAPAVEAYANTSAAPSQAGRYQQDANGNWFDSWSQPAPAVPVNPLFGGAGLDALPGLSGLSSRLAGRGL